MTYHSGVTWTILYIRRNETNTEIDTMKNHSLFAAAAYLTAYRIAARDALSLNECHTRGENCANAFRMNEIKRSTKIDLSFYAVDGIIVSD